MKNKFLILSTFLLSTLICVAKPMITNRRLGDGNWGTHMVPLVTAVVNTKGPVLEMGCGDYSTPLLHSICLANKRFLLTAESDKAWMSLFLDLESPLHHFKYIPAFENCIDKNNMTGGRPEEWNHVGNEYRWSVVFIDHAPGNRRAVDIMRLKSKAEIIVIHDTEVAAYGYKAAINSFKYKFVYERYAKKTTLVSNTIDVAKLFKN